MSNPYLFREMLKSKERDELTPDAVKMFQLMIDNISQKKMYNDENLREDCKAGAMLDILLYWRGFNPDKSDNPFAYFTSMIINGMTKIFNAYMKGAKSHDIISLDHNIHSI